MRWRGLKETRRGQVVFSKEDAKIAENIQIIGQIDQQWTNQVSLKLTCSMCTHVRSKFSGKRGIF